MDKEEHYRHAKTNVMRAINTNIKDAINITNEVIEQHPVVEIKDQENSLGQVTPCVLVRGILRTFAASLSVSKEHLLSAMPDDANQKRWDEVLIAMTLSRLMINERFLAEVSEAVKSDEKIPAHQVRNTLIAIVANYTMIAWQLLKGANSQVVADGFQQYDGLYHGLADLGRLSDIVPFNDNQQLHEFHDWLSQEMNSYQGMERAVLLNNLTMGQQDNNSRWLSISSAQMIVLYVNAYQLTQLLKNLHLTNEKEEFFGDDQKISSLVMLDVLAHHSLNDVYQSYRSVGWIK